MKRTLLSVAVAGGLLASSGVMASDRFAGLSVGAQLGYAQLQTIHTDPYNDCWYWCTVNSRFTDEGFLFGAKADYNMVNGALLYGARLELAFGSLDSQKEFLVDDPSYEIGTKVSMLGSLSGKVGLVSNNLAVYAMLGLAFADADQKYRETDGSGEVFNESGESTGLFYGFGAEYALDGNASIGVDVGRYVFSETNPTLLSSGGVPQNADYRMRDSVTDIKVSYNFKF